MVGFIVMFTGSSKIAVISGFGTRNNLDSTAQKSGGHYEQAADFTASYDWKRDLEEEVPWLEPLGGGDDGWLKACAGNNFQKARVCEESEYRGVCQSFVGPGT